jgi:hypothetical protein
MMSYWPFWAGGLALAVVAVGYFALSGRLLGVSGSLARVLRGPERDPFAGASDDAVEAAMLEATREAFGDAAVVEVGKEPVAAAEAPAPVLFTWSTHATLLVCLIAGGAIGALTRGTFRIRTDMGAEFARFVGTGWRAWVALIGGGLLVGFGTAMAGGCTSGHGLCGTSRAQPGSLVTTASFFGAAVGISFLLQALVQ